MLYLECIIVVLHTLPAIYDDKIVPLLIDESMGVMNYWYAL